MDQPGCSRFCVDLSGNRAETGLPKSRRAWIARASRAALRLFLLRDGVWRDAVRLADSSFAVALAVPFEHRGDAESVGLCVAS